MKPIKKKDLKRLPAQSSVDELIEMLNHQIQDSYIEDEWLEVDITLNSEKDLNRVFKARRMFASEGWRCHFVDTEDEFPRTINFRIR